MKMNIQRISPTLPMLAMLLMTVALVMAVVDAAPSDDLILQHIVSDGSEELGALCNDGTPAAYYIRRTNSTKWHIHLMGGFWCWDKQSCQQRQNQSPNLMSSRDLPKTLSGMTGIFSTDQQSNPVFHDAQHVYVHYCSSDAWSGDAQNKAQGWYFRGKRIVHALVKQLMEKEGMTDATQVLLSGCSAGGLGTLVNADYVGQLIRKYAPPAKTRGLAIDYRVLADSGLFLDVDKLNSTLETVVQRTQIMKGQPLWNGVVDEDCELANGDNEELWKCYLGRDALQYVQSSTLVFQFLSDLWQVAWNIGGGNPFERYRTEENVKDYVDRIGKQTMDELIAAERSNSDQKRQAAMLKRIMFDNEHDQSYENVDPVPSLAFVPSCMWHCAIFNDGFTEIRLTQSGQSVGDVVLAWYSSTRRIRINRKLSVIADKCTTMGCSYGCPTIDN